MKKEQFRGALVGSVLALLVSHKGVAQPITVLLDAPSLAVTGEVAGGPVEDDGPAGGADYMYSLSLDADDKSTAFAAMQTSSSSGATYSFKGWGKVLFTPGVDGSGQPSQLALGQTTSYVYLIANMAVNYEFTTKCLSQDNVDSSSGFNGVAVTQNGSMSFGGTLALGSTFYIAAACNNNNGAVGGAAAWNYVLQLTPAWVTPRFTQAQKMAFLNTSQSQSSASRASFVQAQSAPNSQTAQIFLQVAEAQAATAQYLFNQFLDPLDTNYTQIATVVFPSFAPLLVSNNFTQLEVSAWNAWQTNLSESVGYSAAWNTSINRAQGAAYVSNAYWSTQQMNAAEQYEAELAAVFDQEPALRSNVVAQFAAGGFPAINDSTNEALDFQMEIISNGLPTNIVEGLTELGLDCDAITNIQSDLVTADPASMAGSFPQMLVNTNWDAANTAAASNLRDACLVLMNPAVLPGGQFRFDLPTEPGYTYTIQFARDPANPAGVTTLWTNQATTALFSFTNTSAGGPGGFFRATHN